MGQDICFLNTYRKDLVEACFKKSSNVKFITFSFEARRSLNSNNKEFEFADDYFPLELHRSIDDLANNLTESWYLPFGDDSKYRGVNVGALFTHFISYYFRDVLKSFAIASKALKRHKPSTVYCSPPIPFGRWSNYATMPMYSHLPYVLESCCAKMDIPFVTLPITGNDQRFDVRREERRLFDLAIKGRNLAKDLLFRLTFRKDPAIKRVLSVMLKKGMFDMMKSLDSEEGLTIINYFQAADILSLGTSSQSKEFVRNINQGYQKLRDDGNMLPELPKQFEPTRKAFDRDFGLVLGTEAQLVCNEIDRMNVVIPRFDIDFLLVLEDFTPQARARVAASETLGVESGVILHGFLPKVWHSRYKPPTGTYNFVWGPGYAERFASEGFPQKRVISTGITSADIIFAKPSEEEIDRVKGLLGIPEGKKLVLWATQPPHLNFSSKSMKTFEDDIKAIYRLMKDRKEVLVVKTHPIDLIEHYLELSEEVGFKPIITKAHLPVLIHLCDVLIADSSTVGLQGLVENKPFILLTTQTIKDISGYAEAGMAEVVSDIKDLAKSLDKVLYGGPDAHPKENDVERFLDTYAANRDGSAMKVLLRTIAELIEKKTTKAEISDGAKKDT